MKYLNGLLMAVLITFNIGTGTLWADNQTNSLSPISPETSLPFSIVIETANFQLPIGIHSGVFGLYKGLWVLIAGSHYGLHGFGANPFPPNYQNTSIYVVNPTTGVTLSRSLSDPSSGLTQQQIDSLSSISPQFYQENNTLYISGGYGVDTLSNTLGTKPVFTALNLAGIVDWVNNAYPSASVSANIRQVTDPAFQIAGGEMFKLGNVSVIVFGQNFTGVYDPSSNGDYNEQIRRFQVNDSNVNLITQNLNPIPSTPDPNYRRRDLNIMPALLNNNNMLQYGLVAYSGVFTTTGGAWTVPVVINDQSLPTMADPSLPDTFKQGMNHYVSASAGLYSRKYQSMYHVFFGGISYGYYDTNGQFQTDPELPFINQVTTVQMDKNNHFSQYIMDGQYPVILSTGANPGNPLLFGAGAYFIPGNVLQYPNTVISLDSIRRPTLIGYIVGGIQSTLPNTNTDADSSASPHVFKVTLIPK